MARKKRYFGKRHKSLYEWIFRKRT